MQHRPPNANIDNGSQTLFIDRGNNGCRNLLVVGGRSWPTLPCFFVDRLLLLLACAITHHSHVQSTVLAPCSRLNVQLNQAIHAIRRAVDGTACRHQSRLVDTSVINVFFRSPNCAKQINVLSINIMKVYIERNNLQLELIRSSITCWVYSRLLLRNDVTHSTKPTFRTETMHLSWWTTKNIM